MELNSNSVRGPLFGSLSLEYMYQPISVVGLKINFNVISGKINFDKTIFDNDNIASLELDNSNLYLKGNNLVFNSDILIVVKNSGRLFSFLNTKKSSRKNFKDVSINLEYESKTI